MTNQRHIKIDLNSSNDSQGKPWDFSVTFTPPINFQADRKPEVALTNISIWNSLKNISSNSGNNVFRYYNGSTFSNLNIPEGTYSIEALNTQVQSLITANGDVGANIVLVPNYATLKVDITVLNGYQLDLSFGKLYIILGWNNILVSSSGSGANDADISLGVTNWVVNSNIVESGSSYNAGIASSSLFNFSPNVPPGSLINISPVNLLYLNLGTQTINRINIRITDQNNNLLTNLSPTEPVSLTLIVRY